MAIGKSETQIKLNKLSIKFGEINIVQKGKLIALIMKLKQLNI
jgi:N-acetylglutamate synthase/N-acetylornithine aminotransferase